MPYLGDFLGQLMAELTRARVQADVEATRVAELYADHELLKHFPVPRVRLPEVRIDVPVVHRAEARPAAVAAPTAAALVTDLLPRITDHLRALGVNLSAARVRGLRGRMLERVAPLDHPDGAPVDVGRLSEELTDLAFATLTAAERNRIAAELATRAAELQKVIRLATLRLHPTPLRLDVGVTPEQLREAGEAVTRLQLSLREEGLEWTSLDADGKSVDRLVPE